MAPGLRPASQRHAVSGPLLRAVDERQWRPTDISSSEKPGFLPGGKHPAWKAPDIPAQTVGGFDIETVEIKGRCQVIIWGRRRGEVTNYKAGVLAKIPRHADRFDELKNTTTLTVQQLRAMVCQVAIPAVRIISIPAPRVAASPRLSPEGQQPCGHHECLHTRCPGKGGRRVCSDHVISEAELEKLCGHYLNVATTLMGVHAIKKAELEPQLTIWPSSSCCSSGSLATSTRMDLRPGKGSKAFGMPCSRPETSTVPLTKTICCTQELPVQSRTFGLAGQHLPSGPLVQRREGFGQGLCVRANEQLMEMLESGVQEKGEDEETSLAGALLHLTSSKSSTALNCCPSSTP